MSNMYDNMETLYEYRNNKSGDINPNHTGIFYNLFILGVVTYDPRSL